MGDRSLVTGEPDEGVCETDALETLAAPFAAAAGDHGPWQEHAAAAQV